MSTYFTTVADHTAFASAKFTKADLARGAHLFAGLNCFEPGQAQAVHAHDGADKFYLVLEGKARMRVGDEDARRGGGHAGVGAGRRAPRRGAGDRAVRVAGGHVAHLRRHPAGRSTEYSIVRYGTNPRLR